MHTELHGVRHYNYSHCTHASYSAGTAVNTGSTVCQWFLHREFRTQHMCKQVKTLHCTDVPITTTPPPPPPPPQPSPPCSALHICTAINFLNTQGIHSSKVAQCSTRGTLARMHSLQFFAGLNGNWATGSRCSGDWLYVNCRGRWSTLTNAFTRRRHQVQQNRRS